jgi:hypothetical protein
MIFHDAFYQTHQGEVFQKSQCMQHEHALANLFVSLLTQLGYTATGSDQRTWQRDHKKVIVCFADDFGVCRTDYSVDCSKWFDTDTVVITDNHMPCDTQYQVCQTPVSYFGIFNYVPADQVYRPDRRFNFSVNRIDAQRELILLELAAQSITVDDLLANDYINFNCRDAYGANETVTDIQNNFAKCWNQLEFIEQYQTHYRALLPQLPIRNHDLLVEQAQVSAHVNLVIETYAGDATIALSEKIFRALVTPAPWTVYSAKNAVKYLKSMGFDVLEDLVDHAYNQATQDNSPHGVLKVKQYISGSINTYQQLLAADSAAVAARCRAAATHNQGCLAALQQQWPADFAAWLPWVIAKIQ